VEYISDSSSIASSAFLRHAIGLPNLALDRHEDGAHLELGLELLVALAGGREGPARVDAGTYCSTGGR